MARFLLRHGVGCRININDADMRGRGCSQGGKVVGGRALSKFSPVYVNGQ